MGRAGGGGIACVSKGLEMAFATTTAASRFDVPVLPVTWSAMSTSPGHMGEYVDDALSFAGELDADSSDSGGEIVSREGSKESLSSPLESRKGNEVGSFCVDRLKSSISKFRGLWDGLLASEQR